MNKTYTLTLFVILMLATVMSIYTARQRDKSVVWKTTDNSTMHFYNNLDIGRRMGK
jgi:hypothetical protein